MKNGRKFLLIYLLLQVLKENNVRKEELRVRAIALKILGKIFQVHILTCCVEQKNKALAFHLQYTTSLSFSPKYSIQTHTKE